MAKRSLFLIFYIFLGLCVVFITRLSATGEEDENKTWSFQFSKTPIADVLNRLTEVTGIEISVDKLTEKEPLTKSYTNCSLEYILKDIFRATNYALVWHRGEDGKDSIEIRLFNKGSDSRTTAGNLSNISRTNPRNLSRNPASRISPKPRIQDLDEDEDQPEDADYPENVAHPENVDQPEVEEEEEQSDSPRQKPNTKLKTVPVDSDEELPEE
jgi:type II secretory pathway component GspD/PulD (secretin)